MRITLRQLQVFAAICTEGNITRAASAVGLSQAAASQALAELENLLERKLFHRLGKRVVLNAAGRDLLPRAIEVIDRIGEIEAGGPASAPQLRLGASLTVGSYMLPPVIASFCARHPNYRVQLRIKNTEEVIAGLLGFEFDAGWVEGHVQEPDLVGECWRKDELVIIASPSHPLAGLEVNLKELDDQAWILREKGSGTRDVFERAVQKRLRLDRFIEISGIEAVKRTVMSGFGISCVSSSAVKSELASGTLAAVRVRRFRIQRDITLLSFQQRYERADLKLFLDYARHIGDRRKHRAR